MSDIHVTVHQDSSRHTDLKMFVNEVVPLLKPSLVVVTGDLAHSMEARPHLSKQHEKEWQLYAAAIEDVTVPWLDLRGNHGIVTHPLQPLPAVFFHSVRCIQCPIKDSLPQFVQVLSDYIIPVFVYFMLQGNMRPLGASFIPTTPSSTLTTLPLASTHS